MSQPDSATVEIVILPGMVTSKETVHRGEATTLGTDESVSCAYYNCGPASIRILSDAGALLASASPGEGNAIPTSGPFSLHIAE